MGEQHIWSLGPGAVAELRLTKPLSSRHCDLLLRYVGLLQEVAEEGEANAKLPNDPIELARYIGEVDAKDGEPARTTGSEVARDVELLHADEAMQARLLSAYQEGYQSGSEAGVQPAPADSKGGTES